MESRNSKPSTKLELVKTTTSSCGKVIVRTYKEVSVPSQSLPTRDSTAPAQTAPKK